MFNGYPVNVKNTNVVQVDAKAPNSTKFVGYVRMFEEVYHMLPCPQLSLLALNRLFFQLNLFKAPFPIPFNNSDFPKFPQSYTTDVFLPPSSFYFHLKHNQSV
jgi:hypothetical protein